MLYTFFGTDIEKIRARSRELSEVLKQKRPDASFFRLHLENWEDSKMSELTQSMGLFSSKYIVLLDNILTGISEKKNEHDRSPSEMVLELLPELKTSDHIWIIVEDAHFGASSGKELGVKLSKELDLIKKALDEHSNKVEVHNLKMSSSGGFFNGSQAGHIFPAGESVSNKNKIQINSFAFTDAFFDRNKILALNTLTQLKNQEMVGEEIHGALWWQMKTLMQVESKDTKGISPFVLQKSSRFLKKWKPAEVSGVAREIVTSYHIAHLENRDLHDLIAKMVLRWC